ncbi:FAD-dependent monooxygenase [Aurantimonas coralicida]|uniref:FAD-dependent monooxygenase n=1 Tax=Aurantimonas coralicida TaxID=182270 RepID=UPI00239ADB34|nr:FAD-dependent monooxygenase [Aurantimonas coralicida]MDE0922346.1 FAD-dependent monooxygenase [Aurantimonas coralicida]
MGAGMAGLTMALELARRDRPCIVVELAPRLEEVGAGLQLSPNALRVLARLGDLEDLKVRGTVAETVTLHAAGTGRAIASVPVSSADGTPYLSIHRADLQAWLARAAAASNRIELRLGRDIGAIGRDGGDLRVEAISPDGTEILQTPLVIAADGVNSPTAQRLGLGGPTATGALAWRGRVADSATMQPAGIEAWLGPQRHAVAYPIAGGRETNLVLIEPAGGSADPADLPARFSRWDRRLGTMIASVDGFTAWPLKAVPGARPWRHLDDRLVLIGDAGHAMLPYAAQGAAMAIEDAAVLAAHLDRATDLSIALRGYETERRPRIDKVRSRVGFHRFVYHLPFPLSLGRNAVLASRSAASLAGDLAWLYDWRPPRD